jgi:hypothetical protein
MGVITKGRGFIGVEIRRRIGRPVQYGVRHYGKVNYGEELLERSPYQYGRANYGGHEYGVSLNFEGIYQVRRSLTGRIQVREKFYEPKCQTQPNKVIRQLVFAAAVLAWQGLTGEQKSTYNTRALGKHTQGYNIFITEYLKSH